MLQSRELENMSLNFYGSGKNHSVLKCFEDNITYIYKYFKYA